MKVISDEEALEQKEEKIQPKMSLPELIAIKKFVVNNYVKNSQGDAYELMKGNFIQFSKHSSIQDNPETGDPIENKYSWKIHVNLNKDDLAKAWELIYQHLLDSPCVDQFKVVDYEHMALQQSYSQCFSSFWCYHKHHYSYHSCKMDS